MWQPVTPRWRPKREITWCLERYPQDLPRDFKSKRPPSSNATSFRTRGFRENFDDFWSSRYCETKGLDFSLLVEALLQIELIPNSSNMGRKNMSFLEDKKILERKISLSRSEEYKDYLWEASTLNFLKSPKEVTIKKE